MAHFYGTVKGNKGEAHRCGSKSSGLTIVAKGWNGEIEVRLYHENGIDKYSIIHTAGTNTGLSQHGDLDDTGLRNIDYFDPPENG